MPVPTTIDGLAELQRALERIPREVQALVAADALRAGAAVIQAGAQRRAPRKTGKLAGGMTTTITPIAGGLLAELSATTGANKIGRILDQFGTPVLAAARNARDLGVSAGEIETGMERAARGIGRAHGFLSAINPEFGASALQIHSVVRVASTLTSGFGALALGAAGVAAVVGGLLYRSFGGVFSSTSRATEGVHTLSDQITKLEAEITKAIPSLDAWNFRARLLAEMPGPSGEFGAGGGFAANRLAAIAARLTQLMGSVGSVAHFSQWKRHGVALKVINAESRCADAPEDAVAKPARPALITPSRPFDYRDHVL